MSYSKFEPKSRDSALQHSRQTEAVRQIEIDEQAEGQRLDNFLRTALKGVPKTRLYRLIRKGEVRVNKGRIKPDYKLQIGDLVRIPPVRQSAPEPEHYVGDRLGELLENSILYEDEALLIVNKPSGLAVHGGSGIRSGLIEALRVLRPHERNLELVHRLDRDTSGCIMLAKKRSMLKYLHEQLRANRIQKSYYALVVGRWPKRKQVVGAPLLKNHLSSGERIVKVAAEGKASTTQYRLIQLYRSCSLVEAKPVTGRTHQIRVHCQYAGHPILGDDKYGDPEADKAMREKGLKRLFLHAKSLELLLPQAREPLRVEAPLAVELESVLARLEPLV